MARRLADIETLIKSKEPDFFHYLKQSLDGEVFNFIETLSKLTDVYIFSGIIRNYFLRNYLIRDVDLVVESEDKIEALLATTKFRKNSFGGYKIEIDGINIDLWSIEKTWALKQQETINFELEKYIPSTAFFNFSSIVYSMNKKEFFYTKYFLRFLRDRQLDFVYKPNADYSLCVVNTFYYSDKYNLRISDKLLSLIRYLHEKVHGDYESTQIKHFKEIFYTNLKIEDRFRQENERALKTTL